MKNVSPIAGLLMGFLVFGVQAHAKPQEGGSEIKQKISTRAKKAAALAKAVYQGAPQFAGMRGTSISYATNTNQEILKIGNFYFLYLTSSKLWLTSPGAEGPWVPARLVPEGATWIVCAQLNDDPFEPYQLCTLPWEDYLRTLE